MVKAPTVSSGGIGLFQLDWAFGNSGCFYLPIDTEWIKLGRGDCFVLWGYKVKVIDGGLLSSADVGGIHSSSKVNRGHSSGLCGETKPGSKSNQFDTGKQEAQ